MEADSVNCYSDNFPGGSEVKSFCFQCGRPGFDPWVRKIPWRKKWQPTPVFLPRESHGWRSLVDPSPWGCKESDTTEWLHYLSLSLERVLNEAPGYLGLRTLSRRREHVLSKWELHGLKRQSCPKAGSAMTRERPGFTSFSVPEQTAHGFVFWESVCWEDRFGTAL